MGGSTCHYSHYKTCYEHQSRENKGRRRCCAALTASCVSLLCMSIALFHVATYSKPCCTECSLYTKQIVCRTP